MENNLNEILQIKRGKLQELRNLGIEPYGGRFDSNAKAINIKNNFEEYNSKIVKIAGRLMSKRAHGKTAFCNIEDMSGNIQIYVRKDKIGDESFNVFENLIDIGDIIGIEGEVFQTQKGEISIKITSFELISKCLQVLPEKFHGLTDIELRYRMRYLDLIVNREVKETFIIRSKIIKEIRNFLDNQEYLEVETPVLHTLAGGAEARPFITHHNALDMELYLRISLELHLKRLLVGGIERVYEIGRVFRNEGLSNRHNPEFTLLELYRSYGDLQDMMDVMENMISSIAEKLIGSTVVPYGDAQLEFKAPWKKMTMIESVKNITGIDFDNFKNDEEARIGVQGKIEVNNQTKGELLNEMFEEYVEETLIQPTFITDYPIEISPLAKKKIDNPLMTERFEAFVYGRELGNAFTELNDPIDQKERFMEQVKKKNAGQEETHPYDEDFINALEYGMPSAGGLGIGIDRLVMFLTNSQSIRDVILYPTMRDK